MKVGHSCRKLVKTSVLDTADLVDRDVYESSGAFVCIYPLECKHQIAQIVRNICRVKLMQKKLL